MSQRRAVTKAITTRYKRTSKAGRGAILDELCATTGWHRNRARKALRQAAGRGSCGSASTRPGLRAAGDGGAEVLLGGAGGADRTEVLHLAGLEPAAGGCHQGSDHMWMTTTTCVKCGPRAKGSRSWSLNYFGRWPW